MAVARAADGTRLHVEETGSGEPIVFLHEFAGDHRSWEPQLRWFGQRYRCITYAARGYPPSGVPADPAAYSQDHAVDDALAVIDHLGIPAAHLVGLSMGGFAALHLGLRHPDRCLSLTVAGCGYGSELHRRVDFAREAEAVAELFESEGPIAAAKRYATGPTRVQLQARNPRAWRELVDQLGEHSPVGSALTMRGVQARRPSLYSLETPLRSLSVPMLVVTGDEDDGCLAPSLFLKQVTPRSGLAVLPRTGHTCNLEDPVEFNRLVQDFLTSVALGAWGPRDDRSRSASFVGFAT